MTTLPIQIKLYAGILLLLSVMSIRGFADADPLIDATWNIDLQKKVVNYSITNKTTAAINFASALDVNSRHANDIWPSVPFGKDSIYRLSIEIITSDKAPVESVRNSMGLEFPPIEIKPNTTKSFSYSLNKTFAFGTHPETLKEIESVQFKISLNNNVVYENHLKYDAGQWKTVSQ